MNFGEFDTFVFDLDGTTWIYPKLIPGVKEVYRKLKELKKNILFISNFTILSRAGIARKLNSLGIEVKVKQVINSGYVAAKYLEEKSSVFAVGRGLREELRKNKVGLTSGLDAEYVVIGHDLDFNYNKLKTAVNCLLNGAKFLTTARGRLFPFRRRMYPGTGAIVSAIEYATGKRASMIGKPSNFMVKLVKKFTKGKVVIFGDELDSDIVFGKKAGWATVLVRSGVDKEAKKVKPDKILSSVADLLEFL